MDNQENYKPEVQNMENNVEASKTFKTSNGIDAYKPSFNPHAKPFNPIHIQRYINIGPSQLAVNAKVWQSIASTRQLPPFIPMTSTSPALSPAITSSNGTFCTAIGMTTSSMNLCLPQDAYDYSGFANNNPPAFDADPNPNRRLVFRREFGPVATTQGFIDIRMRRGINILLSLDRAVLIENGEIRIAVSSDAKFCGVEHHNGRVRQTPERIDVIAYDGFKKNNFIRYAKIWQDNRISLTAHGCCLTYLVDPAGTRTTSDLVNTDWTKDYCKDAFFENSRAHTQCEVDHAAAQYNYKIEEDGTESFVICGVRIIQTRDGMVRVICNDRYSIRTSVENRSMSLDTHDIYCTASMSDSPHLFVRHRDRRIHFDCANFIVRNMGHSASFDTANLLRIH